MRYVTALLLAALICGFPAAAHADDVEFGYSYGAQTAESGETELSLWVTDRRGKAQGHYDAQDYRVEVERGLTEHLQASLYANFANHRVRALEPGFEPVAGHLGFAGLSAEFKYEVAGSTAGGVGFALYAEPGWSRIDSVSGERSTEYELELKAILQKNFARDRLVWVGNLTLEPEWERESGESLAGGGAPNWNKELKVEVSTGLAYHAAPRWSVGVEARYASVYPGWTHGLRRAAYAVSAGPMIHFSAGEFGLTGTWLPQLFGRPKERGSVLSLDKYEKNELRLKLSYEF